MATSRKKIRDPGLRAAVETAGTRYHLAKSLGISLSALLRWKRVPSSRVIQIEMLFSVDREVLRPDLYPPRRSSRV